MTAVPVGFGADGCWRPCRPRAHRPTQHFTCWRQCQVRSQAGAPAPSRLRAIAIAHYLERSQIVRSSEGYRMDVLSNEWWGEPLDTMISRILVQELNQRLPGSTVYADNGAISTPPDATVEINLQRLDLDREATAARGTGRGRRPRVASRGVSHACGQPTGQPGTGRRDEHRTRSVGRHGRRLCSPRPGKPFYERRQTVRRQRGSDKLP